MAQIRKLKERLLPKLARQEGMHGDGGGLFLRVRDGHASWVLRVTSAGVRTEVGLGGFPTVSLQAAREFAEKAREKIRAGQPVRARRAPDVPLFRDVYLDAIEHQGILKGWTVEKTKQEWTRIIEIWALPAFGDKRVDRITRDDILALLNHALAERSGAHMHSLRAKLAAIFSFCRVQGFLKTNIAEWRGNLDQFLPPKGASHSIRHHAAPSFELLRDEIVPAMIARDDVNGRYILLGILTVLRANECAGARWSEIDLPGAVLSVPWERIKNAKRSREAFRVPLSAQAVGLLSGMERTGDRDSPVFVNRRGRSFDRHSGWNLLHRRWPAITFHGIRSTFRDWCAREDVPFHVAEKCLNHAVGNQVVRAYFRDDLLDQRREVMQRWADAVMPRGSCKEILYD